MDKKFFNLLLTIVVLFISSNVFCKEQTKLDIVLNNLEKENKTITDFQTKYFQTITYLSTDEQLSSEGIFKYKKQNYIYLEQTKPTSQYIYIDGKNITTYIPANRQAIVEKWKDVVNSDMILTSVYKFINNWKTFKKDFIVELKEETKVNYLFLIKSKDVKEKWEMTINISKNTFQVIKVSFNNGNFTVNIKLVNYRLNNNFSKDMFKFVVPKNIEVICL